MNDPNDTPPPDGGIPSEQPPASGRTFSEEQVSHIVRERLSQDRRARGASGSQKPPSSSPTPGAGPSLDGAAITRRALAFQSAGYSADEIEAYATDPGIAMPAPPPRGQGRTPQGPPVTATGAPASSTTITDDTPIMRMTDSDRIALRRRIGDTAFVERMRNEFRSSNVRVRFR